MARVLRRPMFRMGGNTDQGIMSGVAPRQGYKHGEDVDPGFKKDVQEYQHHIYNHLKILNRL